jgi:hypothetical protein
MGTSQFTVSSRNQYSLKMTLSLKKLTSGATTWVRTLTTSWRVTTTTGSYHFVQGHELQLREGVRHQESVCVDVYCTSIIDIPHHCCCKWVLKMGCVHSWNGIVQQRGLSHLRCACYSCQSKWIFTYILGRRELLSRSHWKVCRSLAVGPFGCLHCHGWRWSANKGKRSQWSQMHCILNGCRS